MSDSKHSSTTAERAEAIGVESDVYAAFDTSFSVSEHGLNNYRARQDYREAVGGPLGVIAIVSILAGVVALLLDLAPFWIYPAGFVIALACIGAGLALDALINLGNSRDEIAHRDVFCYNVNKAVDYYATDDIDSVRRSIERLCEGHTGRMAGLSQRSKKVLSRYHTQVTTLSSDEEEDEEAMDSLRAEVDKTFPLLARRLVRDLSPIRDDLDRFLYDPVHVEAGEEEEELPSEPNTRDVLLADLSAPFGPVLGHWIIQTVLVCGVGWVAVNFLRVDPAIGFSLTAILIGVLNLRG